MPPALAPILLALSPLPLRDDGAGSAPAELAATLPAEADVVVLVGDLAATREGASPWGRVVRDPRWADVLRWIDEVSGEQRMAEAVQLFGELLAGVRAVAMARADARADDWVAALSVDTGWLAEARGKLAAHGLAVEDAEVAGLEGIRVALGGDAVLVVGREGRAFAAGPTDEGAAIAIARALASPDGAGVDAPWRTSAEGAPDALLEVFLESPRQPDPAAREVVGELELLHVRVALDEGGGAELTLRASFSGSETTERIAEVLRPADVSLLGLAPPGFDPAVLGFDPAAAVEAALDLAERSTPGAREEFELMLRSGAELLGLDFEEALLRNLTGQILAFQRTDDPDLLAQAMLEDEDEDVPEALMPVVALGVEETDALLHAGETIVGLAEAEGDRVEWKEVGAVTVWTFEPEPDVEVSVAVGGGLLAAGAADGVAELVGCLADPRRPRAFDAAVVDALDAELEGELVMVGTLGSTLDMAESATELSNDLFAREVARFAPPPEDDADAFAEPLAPLLDVVAVLREHLSGFLASELRMAAGEASVRVVLLP